MAVSVVTDFEAHALWMDACVDLYCVAAEETKARLVARGAAPEDVVVTGIPISARFSAKLNPKAVRKSLGLRDDLPVLLVPSGGFGMGPVGEILAELDKVERPFQSVVVTGRNEELRRELAAQDRKHPTHVLGFATNMHELMAVADLIITKPGGLTSSEALAMGKPLFILNPIPGQEAANSDFLLEHGAAAKVNRVEDLPYRIEQLLGIEEAGRDGASGQGAGQAGGRARCVPRGGEARRPGGSAGRKCWHKFGQGRDYCRMIASNGFSATAACGARASDYQTPRKSNFGMKLSRAAPPSWTKPLLTPKDPA